MEQKPNDKRRPTEEEDSTPIPFPWIIASLALGAGVVYLLVKSKVVTINTNTNSETIDYGDLIISPTDTDLAYSPSQFHVTKSPEEDVTMPISGTYLTHALLTCQILRHVEFIRRDALVKPNLISPDGGLQFRSGGFKRFYNYLKSAKALVNANSAEGAIRYTTSNGLIFAQTIDVLSPSNIPSPTAYASYRGGFTMLDRLHDTLMFYSLTRGLFTNTLILDYAKTFGSSNGISLNSLKRYDKDFRISIAMSPSERDIVNGIIAKGYTILVDPLTGAFSLNCAITVSELENLVVTAFETPST